MATSNKCIRLLLVDDHEVVRSGLGALLGQHGELEVVGEAGTVAAALETAERLKPDVVLLDVRLPDGSGFEACRSLHKLTPPVKVIILTAFADDEIVMQAIGSGAEGYLLKEIDEQGLVRAIKEVAEGRSILDPAVTRRVMNRVKDGAGSPPAGKLDRLSAQERRVLELVAQGKTNKEIGLAMGLSDKTVKNYLSNLMEKLQMNRRSQAAAFFVQHSGS
ncbi:MAG: two component LuxR family transcriptional regulator [Limisphaerales bacterium]|nr:MAG: two component LuxR family transcriptional regulator [Limisphaerales bacterium]KAG0507276.1 MAG: two component LuxR family transcriptional regulator [Limisphaerales bacterium]TXT46749.1 MAG: two component LuxR family transcriptional regulator [Limisphaerales bacterium]